MLREKKGVLAGVAMLRLQQTRRPARGGRSREKGRLSGGSGGLAGAAPLARCFSLPRAARAFTSLGARQCSPLFPWAPLG